MTPLEKLIAEFAPQIALAFFAKDYASLQVHLASLARKFMDSRDIVPLTQWPDEEIRMALDSLTPTQDAIATFAIQALIDYNEKKFGGNNDR